MCKIIVLSKLTPIKKIVIQIQSDQTIDINQFSFMENPFSGSGLQWSNLSKPLNVDDNFSMAIVFVMLIFDSLLYLFIMFYVDNVWPGEYGIPQRWYFLFTVSISFDLPSFKSAFLFQFCSFTLCFL